MKKILIAIQARSGSSRLPNKIHLNLGGKPILQWVLDSCKYASDFVNRNARFNIVSEVAILAPENDALIDLYKHKVNIITGSEEDVLSRYVKALHHFECDYVVRITSDCASIPSHIISRCIKAALLKGSDYTSNVLVRTHKEGWDTEVISRGLLEWLGINATEPEDREHVTSLVNKWHLNRNFDFPFTICHILNETDESQEHTSIDTSADYEKALEMIDRIKKKKQQANESGVFIL